MPGHDATLERRAATVTLVSALAFLSLLALLHGLEPEIAPSWRMISEYQLGRFGWAMSLAFFSLAVATLALVATVRPHSSARAGKAGLVLLVVCALGIVLGGAFVTDPITTERGHGSTSGTLHTIGGSLMILLSPLAVSLVGWSLARHHAQWRPARLRLLLPTLSMWLTWVAFFAVVASHADVARAGPEVPIGWPNRAFMVSYVWWLVAVAHQARRSSAASP